MKEDSAREPQSAERLDGDGAHRSRSALARSDHSDRYVWYVILLLTFVNAINYVDRMALAMLAPLIKADLKLTDAQLGVLTGFAFAIFYAACAIPIARWADRGIRRNVIALAVTVWSVMTALSAGAQNFWHLLVARIGVGAGEAGSYAPGASIVCDYVPMKHRSGALAVFNLGNAAGILVGMVIAGWLGEVIGWRAAFVVLALPGFAVALIVRFTLREPTRGFFDSVDDKTGWPLNATIRLLFACRTYRSLVIFLCANGFVQFGLHQWWPSFYSRIFGTEVSTVGLYLGIALGVGMGLGMFIGGIMADKTGVRDVSLPLRVGAIMTSLSLPTAFASVIVPSMTGSIALVCLTGLFWGVSYGPVLAAKYSVVTPSMRATAGAVAILFISVLGFGLGPFCVGMLSDLLAPSLGVESLRYALFAPICLIPVMIVALLAAAKTLSEDLKAVGTTADKMSIATSSPKFAAAK